jgi:alkylhydroperoxidase family enzyme
LTRQVLEDYTTAPIDEKLRAMLGLLQKMTLDHANFGPDDVKTALRLGVTKDAIAEAMEVAFLFNIYDRLADAMGWDVPSESGGYYQVAARRLLKHGYR